MNSLHQLADLVPFFRRLPVAWERWLSDPSHTVGAEEVAQGMGLPLPPLLAGSRIRRAEDAAGVSRTPAFVLSTQPRPFWAGLFAFRAKTHCYLVCWTDAEQTRCLHLCVSCFDGWPGPGCYLHGSYD